jgi:hypothetical protein
MVIKAHSRSHQEISSANPQTKIESVKVSCFLSSQVLMYQNRTPIIPSFIFKV